MPATRRAAHPRPPLRLASGATLAAALMLAFAAPAKAGLSVSPLVIDLAPGDAPRGDVELRNTGDERLYVRIEPARIEQPGLPGEARVADPDPSVLGLIATPSQVILEPRQRKFLRLALLLPPGDKDRVFRVTVKPVAGDVGGAQTGLKLLVGYDMLLIQRPAAPSATVSARREGDALVLSNAGNTNVELFHGRRCVAGKDCTDLPSERLYAGQSVRIYCKAGGDVSYLSKIQTRVEEAKF